MRPGVLILLGILVIALLTLVCSCRVQEDVLERASADLEGSGHEWAKARVDGRYVTVSGVAPSEAQVSSAVAGVRGLAGVLRAGSDAIVYDVTDRDMDPVRGELARSGYYWVGIDRSERDLALSGLAPSAGDRDAVSELAAPLWPWGSVDNRIGIPSTPADRAALACRTELASVIGDRNVGFESGSALLSSADRSFLREVAVVLAGCPGTRIRIEAHSDKSGGSVSNMTLSQARAQSVLDYLVSAGVGSRRLTSAGFGDARPIDSNDTDEGKARNRRVEFRLQS